MAEMLTPRSKVAKMLAEIDNAPSPSPRPKCVRDSTEAINALRSTDAPMSSPSAATRKDATADSSLSRSDPFLEQPGHDSDESSVSQPRRPVGRIARRMFPAQQASASASLSPDPNASVSSATRPQALDNQDYEDDLYSATPVRSRPALRDVPGPPMEGTEGAGGLFVSPAKPDYSHSDDELPTNPFGSKERLAELVAQKRAEREAREKQGVEKRKRRTSSERDSRAMSDELFENSQDVVNPDIERIMSDAARPTRKATKKALLEIERETQRLARQQALAHQMKVKKKFTTNDLFATFNFRQQLQTADTAGDTTASSAPNSDSAEVSAREPVSTPPSSPPTPLDRQKEIVERGALSRLVLAREDSLTSLASLVPEDAGLSDMAKVLQAAHTPRFQSTAVELTPATEKKKGFKIARLGKKPTFHMDDSSDDDLEVIPSLPAHLSAFDKVRTPTESHPGNSSKAIHTLRHLSRIGAYDKVSKQKNAGPSVNPSLLDAQLRKRAKDQARLQQLERIAELKAKGIEIQTVEEKEHEAEVFENLLDKARLEAVKLRKAEKAAMKAAAGETANEAIAEASEDETEDDDYIESGSEDEEIEQENEEEEGEEEEEEKENHELIDDAAEDADVDDDEYDHQHRDEVDSVAPEPKVTQGSIVDVQSSELDSTAAAPTKSRRVRKSRVVRDDEDSDDSGSRQDQPVAAAIATYDVPDNEDPFAAFNFGSNKMGELLMSPTQAFNATMQTPTQATQEDSLDILRRIARTSVSPPPPPSSCISIRNNEIQVEEGQTPSRFVPGSQSEVFENQRINLTRETQPPATPVQPGLTREVSDLTETPGWEPTQDAGMPSPWTGHFSRKDTPEIVTEEHETQSTVQLRVSESPAPSAVEARRGRLTRQRAVARDDSSGSEPENAMSASSTKPLKTNAFREMQRRRKEALTEAERTEAQQQMKAMMDEQAEESEDEYAGLGGDDFVAPETAQDQEMIDTSHINVDERQLAAHFAERQRIRDEEETSRLYKDLTTGALRRKQASMFDIDEDDDEVAARRQQMKLREEARKRKLLLQDDNIAGLAEGKHSKGKDAFLKAIADDDGEDDMPDWSDGEVETQPSTQDECQQHSQQQALLPATVLQETSGNKRRFAESEEKPEDRLPAKQRRTQASAFRRPASMVEVKESVSFLLDEPNTIMTGPTVELDSDSEHEQQSGASDEDLNDKDEAAREDARQNNGGFAPNPTHFDTRIMPPPRLPASQRRTAAKSAVVDRLSLKRSSSSNSSTSSGPTAWASGTGASAFKAPSLLRRATTNMTTTANERGVTTYSPSLSRENSGGVKMGGSKKSSLAYQARAEERKAIVEASARRRQENTARIAQLRRSSTAGGMLGRGLSGRFE